MYCKCSFVNNDLNKTRSKIRKEKVQATTVKVVIEEESKVLLSKTCSIFVFTM